ncbi:uncharacterized protein LOC143297181 [Babylonia areolata]|uniref:uncharacterized protein LOC143297181 n=1 Tax=Babylonia areolata TaxID=304850 RepID=UPI003FD195C3
MADSHGSCEEGETTPDTGSISEEGSPWQQPAQGPSPQARLEEKDQTGILWSKEEEGNGGSREEEVVDSSDTTEDEEEVDPRVAENLEIMNQSCAEVNRLENELDEARGMYRSTFQTSSQRMEELGGKMRKSIQRARQYFELSDMAKQAQSEALRAARQYQSANGNYRAAIEMVTLAEKGLDDTSAKTRTLNSAWQETLSHAVERVTEAEREKTRSESEHNKKAAVCAQLESRIHFLEKKYKRSIAKARPYFETKAELELKLQQLKQNVWDLQHAIGIRKTRYADALRCLEAVSTEIHESRRSRKKMLLQYPREPGVGAETDSLGSSISDANIERGVFSTSNPLPDEEDDDEESDDVGDVFSSETGNSQTEASGRSAHKQRQQQYESEDCGSACSPMSDSVFCRSVSSGSVVSEGHSESASDPPVSPTTVPAVPRCTAVDMGCPTSPTFIPVPSLMDLARGEVVGSQQTDSSDGQSPYAATEGGCRPGADLTTPTAGAKADIEAASDQQVEQCSAQFPAADCQREAGDGSAQEDCPREADSSNQLPMDPQAPLCSGFSSVLTAPHQHTAQYQEQPLKTADVQSETAGLTPVMSRTQAVSGDVQKTPLRRTDFTAQRPLQGIMLLNPSDLATSSFHFGPRM